MRNNKKSKPYNLMFFVRYLQDKNRDMRRLNDDLDCTEVLEKKHTIYSVDCLKEPTP